MPRKKLKRIIATKDFVNIFKEPKDLKGKWNAKYFQNQNIITLELACGKGEYTVALAQMFPDCNFIGVDRKADRLYCGAKKALELELNNVAFIQIDIKDLADYFKKDEISEIWITFPDPMPKKRQVKHRLTSPNFLKIYQKLVKKLGSIHLKTDDQNLFSYSIKTIESEKFKIQNKVTDLYQFDINDPKLKIQTTFEKKHLKRERKYTISASHK